MNRAAVSTKRMVPALIVATMILLGPFSHTQDVLGDGRGDGPTPVIEFDDPEYVRAASQYDLPLNLSEIRDLDEYEELTQARREAT